MFVTAIVQITPRLGPLADPELWRIPGQAAGRAAWSAPMERLAYRRYGAGRLGLGNRGLDGGSGAGTTAMGPRQYACHGMSRTLAGVTIGDVQTVGRGTKERALASSQRCRRCRGSFAYLALRGIAEIESPVLPQLRLLSFPAGRVCFYFGRERQNH